MTTPAPLRPDGAPTRVGIVIFPLVEVLDFCGPFEVFSVARLDEARRLETRSPFKVRLIAESAEPVSATGGMRVVPDHTLADCPPLDLLVVPGGWGTRREVDNRVLVDWIAARGAGAETLTSVCTGSFLLAEAGLLSGKRATTHWRSLERMREAYPGVQVIADRHWVEDGDVVTSAGISAGIDMSLRVVARYYGEAVARATARHMEYPYPESDARRIDVSQA
jgi:transcriptional regulator GlxA family with amidase domain